MDFEVVLIGTDANAYYMARNFHEAYGKKSYVIGRLPMQFTANSKIMNLIIKEDLIKEGKFVKYLVDLAKQINKKNIILVGCNDDYVSLIIENKDELKKYYLFNYTNEELLEKLVNKEKFYNSFKDSILDLPQTCFYDLTKNDGLEEIKDFQFPIIIKPSNVVKYHQYNFEGQAKVYKLNNLDETLNTINLIKKSGYDDKLIIQEFIPGDDHLLFDSVFYCDSNKKATLQSFGQIGLQEHTKSGIGNLTVIINGYNEFNNTNIIQDKLKQFIESVGYNGICEFDLKYDTRDNKFKVFEINPRQPRSGYYLTACGYNLAKYLVEDLIEHKKNEFTLIKEKAVLSFVPDYVVKHYIENEDYKKEFFDLKKKKLYANPLKYKMDKSFKRNLLMFLRDINYIRKYKNNSW